MNKLVQCQLEYYMYYHDNEQFDTVSFRVLHVLCYFKLFLVRFFLLTYLIYIYLKYILNAIFILFSILTWDIMKLVFLYLP